jgi:hypothetical protein
MRSKVALLADGMEVEVGPLLAANELAWAKSSTPAGPKELN